MDARKPQDGPKESREDRNNRRNMAPRDGAPAGPDGDGAKRGGRGGLRGGRGGPRGGPGGRGGGRGGKRDFDRKSGDDKTWVAIGFSIDFYSNIHDEGKIGTPESYD